MNRILLIIFVTLSIASSFSAEAQETKAKKNFDREAFEARRDAFIVAEVGLTPEEAERFIPLCNELRKKKFELRRECRRLSKEIKRMPKPTSDDYNKFIDECLDVELKEAQLEKEYFDMFRKILDAEKIYKYRDAEFKFARDFMKGNWGNKMEEKHKK